MKRNQYSSDLTEQEWVFLEDLIPPAKFGGRPRQVEVCEILNAVFYVLRAGCAWRLMPHDFPNGKLFIIIGGSGGSPDCGNESMNSTS